MCPLGPRENEMTVCERTGVNATPSYLKKLQNKKTNTELGAHCWQINSIILVYTRPHIIQGGLAEREKQMPGLLVPPAVMACSVAVPDKCCCDGLSADTVAGSSLVGTEAKSLVYRGVREQRTHIYLRECNFQKAFGPARCVNTRGCQVRPHPWTGHPTGKWDLTPRRDAFSSALLPSIMG